MHEVDDAAVVLEALLGAVAALVAEVDLQALGEEGGLAQPLEPLDVPPPDVLGAGVDVGAGEAVQGGDQVGAEQDGRQPQKTGQRQLHLALLPDFVQRFVQQRGACA